MNNSQIKKYYQRMMKLLIILAGILAVLLVSSQYLIVSGHFVGEHLTLLSSIEGDTAERLEETYLAGNSYGEVYYVQLAFLDGEEGDLARIYLDGHLIGTLTAKGSKTVAIEPSQKLTFEGAALTTDTAIKIKVQGQQEMILWLSQQGLLTVFDNFTPNIEK